MVAHTIERDALMNPRIERPQPVYRQIVAHFRAQIRDGELSDGDRLPTVREIAEEFDVAYTTVAKALRTLKSEGLVATSQHGTTVCFQETGTYTPRDRISSVRRLGRIYPPSEYARIVSAEVVAAPADIADHMGVAEGDPVIRRERVTYHGDTPVTYSVSWMPGGLADEVPELLSTERIPGGTVGLVAERTGRQVDPDSDSYRECAWSASALQADRLGIAEGDPVLWGQNTWPEADGTVLEFGEYYIPKGRWVTVGS